VVQLLALEVDLRAAAELGEAFGEVQRARAADVVALEVGQFLEERRILLGLLYSAASSWISGIRVSATYWPPKLPNRPLASGPLRNEVMGRLLDSRGVAAMVRP